MRYSETRPITQRQFDQLVLKISDKFRDACNDIYYYGDDLTTVCYKYNLIRRTFQNALKKNATKYMDLRYGHIALKMSKGYTVDSIRKELGLSTRGDLNNMMWEQVRGDVRPAKRWRVLTRDNFRCVLCGADATDRKLHIDHIIPISKGGKSIMTNLRVLCSQCNIGRNTDLKNIKNTNKMEQNKGI